MIPAPVPTVEPLPGLAIDLNVNSVEETTSGAIVSLSLETTSAVPLELLDLVMHLPPHVMFADGSKQKTWQVTFDAGGRSVLSLDLLVDRKGRFHLSAEAIGTSGGRPIRRGIAYPLVVGMNATRPETTNGALQYRGLVRSRGGGR